MIINDLKRVEDFLLKNDEISENQIEEYTALIAKVKEDLSKQKSVSKNNIPA